MSHNTTIATSLNSETDLCAALREMGIAYTVGKGQRTKSRWTSAPPIPADITFMTTGGDKVGFKKNEDGNYTLVGDLYSGIATKDKDSKRILNQTQFLRRVQQLAAGEGAIRAIRARYSSILPSDIRKTFNNTTKKYEITIRVRKTR